MSLLKNTDSVLITTPDQGGHASIPIILDKLGINYEAMPYDYDNYQIDYKELNNLCKNRSIQIFNILSIGYYQST